MTLIYALVARENNVLVEQSAPGRSGNFSTVTRVLLKRLSSESDSKLSYIYDKYIFHYMVSDHLIYLCMTDENFSRVAAFEFLAEIQQKFTNSFGERAKSAFAYAYNADFGPSLLRMMKKYNSSNNDPVAKIREDVDQVKNVMIQNVDKVLERRERVEILVEKTEDLQNTALNFKRSSRNLRRAMWWKNVKFIILIFVIVIAIIFIIVASACGGIKLPKC